jgi:DNA repair photolyase
MQDNINSRKLKLNKKFQPIPCDAGDEFFPNGIFEFNITKLLVFISANKDQFQPEEVEVRSVRKWVSKNLDESTIKNANILTPIILAEISPGLFNVIDGRHRLEKAYRDGVIKILAYKLLAEQHIMFMTSVKSYEEYVQYWNNKIKDRMRDLRGVNITKISNN